MVKKNSTSRVRGIYLLPNLLTTAGLFAAFYGIIAAFKGAFDVAAIAIFIAMIADAFDGRVARMTNTESAFGGEYDSLADMVSFGLAPALIIYAWALQDLGKLGWLAAFLYTACTGLRLARFNTQIGAVSKQYFQGLPSPSAAAIVVGFVWFCDQNGWYDSILNGLACFLTVSTAILMVSNIRYHSFKEWDLKGKVPFIVMVLIVLLYVSISLNPPGVLFLGFLTYAFSGPVMTLWRLRLARDKKKVGAALRRHKERT